MYSKNITGLTAKTVPLKLSDTVFVMYRMYPLIYYRNLLLHQRMPQCSPSEILEEYHSLMRLQSLDICRSVPADLLSLCKLSPDFRYWRVPAGSMFPIIILSAGITFNASSMSIAFPTLYATASMSLIFCISGVIFPQL